MGKNTQENNKEKDQEKAENKKNFFKKAWYSISKIEKYSELSAEGFPRALKYLIVLTFILAIISAMATEYRTFLEVQNINKYIKESAPNFTYKDGLLSVEQEETIKEDNTNFGKIIIDTKIEDENIINQYISEIEQEENGLILLKDKFIIKQPGAQHSISYVYNNLTSQIGIDEFNNQSLSEYLTGSNMFQFYINLILVLCLYAFIIELINILLYIFVIYLFGFLTALVLRLKIRSVAIFNMAIYSITLPTILDMIYISINAFCDYTIKYFEVMYVLVASIYMIASIFMLKMEFNKKQGEVQKIIEVEEQVKEELEEREKVKEENKDKEKSADKDDKENTEDEEENSKNEEGTEGTNA